MPVSAFRSCVRFLFYFLSLSGRISAPAPLPSPKGVKCGVCVPVSGSACAEQAAEGSRAAGSRGEGRSDPGRWVPPARPCSGMHTEGLRVTPSLLPLQDSSLLPSHYPPTATPNPGLVVALSPPPVMAPSGTSGSWLQGEDLLLISQSKEGQGCRVKSRQ